MRVVNVRPSCPGSEKLECSVSRGVGAETAGAEGCTWGTASASSVTALADDGADLGSGTFDWPNGMGRGRLSGCDRAPLVVIVTEPCRPLSSWRAPWLARAPAP